MIVTRGLGGPKAALATGGLSLHTPGALWVWASGAWHKGTAHIRQAGVWVACRVRIFRSGAWRG